MIRPLRNLVVIDSPEEEQVTTSGIQLVVKEQTQRTGTVLAVGPGVHIDGEFVPTVVKTGDKVVFIISNAEKIKLNGQEYLVVAESNLYGTVEG